MYECSIKPVLMKCEDDDDIDKEDKTQVLQSLCGLLSLSLWIGQ